MTRIWILYSYIAMALVGWADSKAYEHFHAGFIGHTLKQPMKCIRNIQVYCLSL